MANITSTLLSSEYALLGFLYEKPAHGYELYKHITNPEGIGMIWGVKMANLYAQLSKLEKKQFISGTVLPGDMRPARTQFSITLEGKKVFEDWINTGVMHPREFRPDFMLKLYFAKKYLSPDFVKRLCKAQLIECEHWLLNTEDKKKTDDQSNPFKQTILEYRSSQIRSQVSWLHWLTDQNQG